MYLLFATRDTGGLLYYTILSIERIAASTHPLSNHFGLHACQHIGVCDKSQMENFSPHDWNGRFDRSNDRRFGEANIKP